MTTRMPEKQRKLVIWLSIAGVLMFGFAYALVPMYEWICRDLGYNGKLMRKPEVYEQGKIAIDHSRTIKVRLLTDIKGNVPWEFYPDQEWITIHPGELVETQFTAKNNGVETIATRVVVNTIPSTAVKNMHEVVSCFCLKTHELAPGERARLPVGFYIDTELPKEVTEVMVSYTLFKTTVTPVKHENHHDHHHVKV
jgi:cytochrome c oxidase assembly protein subunit 11